MNIDQQIYEVLLTNVGGKQKDIKGLSMQTLQEMKKGSKKMSFSKLFDALKENGITNITLESKKTKMHFAYDGKEKSFSVTTVTPTVINKIQP